MKYDISTTITTWKTKNNCELCGQNLWHWEDKKIMANHKYNDTFICPNITCENNSTESPRRKLYTWQPKTKVANEINKIMKLEKLDEIKEIMNKVRIFKTLDDLDEKYLGKNNVMCGCFGKELQCQTCIIKKNLINGCCPTTYKILLKQKMLNMIKKL